MAYVLVLGAASDIAREISREFAKKGYDLYLAVREADLDQLQGDPDDFQVRYGVTVKVVSFDALDFASHRAFFESLDPFPEGTVCVVGYLGDQVKGQSDWEEARRILDTNYAGPVSLLNLAAEQYEKDRKGFIIGVSSVAGDRGRMSNYLYGSAKAGLTAYLSGLRHRLFASGVNVLTVKPGFVKTRMTEGMDLNPALTAEPEQVAADIIKAWEKGRNTLYTRWFWRWIMLIITHLPECVFKRTKL
jgi:short-subunit dehydrogenase